ncbi:hypothetical protein GY21_19755 [Cryobacterium roopkundense]|uniref:Uncharacterized protein n=1 Tax=Cryobacterium roopkundense TaxID=1001240 RepID=A0A099J2M0_9MICO|nr:hypothetical protein [Cryobacterium roopkundense]KGJ71802.1 hypothetical protein GY21_19755 [Cryobacterium roopkundense]MBB5643604.1 hypothetical protein [Cryobacterium roopkundense]
MTVRGGGGWGFAYALLVSGVIVTVGASAVWPQITLVAGALTLGCAAVGLVLVARTQRIVASILMLLGIASLIIGLALGGEVTTLSALSVNQDLIGMLTAVSFLRLVTPVPTETRSRLRGAPAVVRTAVATHALGAVINLGAVGIVGDHLRGSSKLRLPDAAMLSRAYSAAAFWSPFWAAAAAATSLVPGANSLVLILVGLPLALVAICLSCFDIFRMWGSDLRGYTGYTLGWALIRIPLALVALVVLAHQVWPEVPVPRIVLLAALAVTLVGLLLQKPNGALRRLARHARYDLPNLRGEVTLFASAGILAVGLRVLFPMVSIGLPFTSFTVPVAWACLVVMVLFALIGVHPVVSVAVVAAIALPLNPDPTLFVLAASIGWGVSTSVGPLTGLTMFLHGRYGIDSIALTRRNFVYLAIVLAAAWPALWLCETLVS